MGCLSSKVSSAREKRRSTIYGRRNTLVTRPKVNLNVGDCIPGQVPPAKGGAAVDAKFSQVQQSSNNFKLIFIFGGPGSGKGKIVNNLIEMYNINFICGEDIILHEVQNMCFPDGGSKVFSQTATKEMAYYLQDNPDKLTRKFVLELLENEILKYKKGDVILIDMVPNLKFLLRSQAFSHSSTDDRSVTADIEEFEKKFPIQFAINLQLHKSSLINNITQTHACARGIADGKKKEANKDDSGQSDEIDTSRTERRFNIYINSVDEFIRYFESRGKLLKVDTSSGDIEAVWLAIRDYIFESRLAKPVRGIEQIILFQMDAKDFLDIDNDRYPLLTIAKASLMDDYETASPEKLLKQLSEKMSLHAVEWKGFLFECHGTNLCDASRLEKTNQAQLIFEEVEIGTLDFYLHGLRRRTDRKKSIARKQTQCYKTITTSDNEALIFPIDTDSTLCRNLALMYLKYKAK